MAYEKQNWKTGDVVTSAKLNHMEDGIAGAGGVFVVTMTYDAQTNIDTLDKTYNQIKAAMLAGQWPMVVEESDVPAGEMFSIDFIAILGIDQNDSYYVVTMNENRYSATDPDALLSTSAG